HPPHGIGCDGVVDEVRISKTLRSIERVPSAPFTADEHTIGLWHFDSLENNRFRDFTNPVARPESAKGVRIPRSSQPTPFEDSGRATQAALLAELKQMEGELAAYAVPIAYTGVMHQPEPTVVYLRGDIRMPGPGV